MNDAITVRLPAALRRKLSYASRRKKLPAGQLVREALERYLAVERFRELRSQTIPFAERAGLLTDEDVLKGKK